MTTATDSIVVLSSTSVSAYAICHRASQKIEIALHNLNRAWNFSPGWFTDRMSVAEINKHFHKAITLTDLLWSCGHLSVDNYSIVQHKLFSARTDALARRKRALA